MTLLTKQEIEALLDGTAPGWWDHRLYHCGKAGWRNAPALRDWRPGAMMPPQPRPHRPSTLWRSKSISTGPREASHGP